MAETQRTLASVLTLLADNTSGAISPTDLRDAVETLRPGHGEIYISSSAATTLSDTTTWVEAAGTYTLSTSPTAHWWAEATNARLNYTGVADSLAEVSASVSMTSGSSTQDIEIGIGKNGTILTPSIVRRKIGTGSDVGAAPIVAQVDVSTTDYLSIMIRNITAANNVTLDLANLCVKSSPL